MLPPDIGVADSGLNINDLLSTRLFIRAFFCDLLCARDTVEIQTSKAMLLIIILNVFITLILRLKGQKPC